MNESRSQRRQAKTRAQRFLNIMEKEFSQSPKMAQAILEEAESCLQGQAQGLRPGQTQVILLRRGVGHGSPLRELPTIEVVWTIDAGLEDAEVKQRHGRVALRRTRIQRLLSEALAQGAVASQEDLAQALHVSVRTIKRDCKALQGAGVYLPTRGRLAGIGRGQTHKAQIVGHWLRGATYDQVAQRTQHSLTSVKRYVQAFVRAVQLHQQNFTAGEISLALQISSSLVADYLVIHAENDTPFCRLRLAEELARLQRSPRAGKRGA